MSKISLAMCSTVGLLSVLKTGSRSASSGATSGSSRPQDHLVVELAVDPALHDALDVGEIHDHVAAVELGRADVHFDDRVVAVRVLADAVVVEKPMAVAEVDALGDQIHRLTVTYAQPDGRRRGAFLGRTRQRGAARAGTHERRQRSGPSTFEAGSPGSRRRRVPSRGCLPLPPFAGRVASVDNAQRGHARCLSSDPLGRCRTTAGVRHAG